LLFVVVLTVLLPAVFDLTERIAAPGMNTSLIDERLSLAVSMVLLLLYAANLIYTLVTHGDVFAREVASGQAQWLFQDIGSTWRAVDRRPTRSGSSLCSPCRTASSGLRPFRPQAQIAEPNGEKNRQRTQEDKNQVTRQP
jgi:Ca2+/H+ antiporter